MSCLDLVAGEVLEINSARKCLTQHCKPEDMLQYEADQNKLIALGLHVDKYSISTMIR